MELNKFEKKGCTYSELNEKQKTMEYKAKSNPMPAPTLPPPYIETQFQFSRQPQASWYPTSPIQVQNQQLSQTGHQQTIFYTPSIVYQQSFDGFNQTSSSDNLMKRCYNCDQAGHMSRDCKRPRACFICGVPGHVARQCKLNKETSSKQEVAVESKTNAEEDHKNHKVREECLNCGKIGHRLKDCANAKKCFICGVMNHVARDCPSALGSQRRASLQTPTYIPTTPLVGPQQPGYYIVYDGYGGQYLCSPNTAQQQFRNHISEKPKAENMKNLKPKTYSQATETKPKNSQNQNQAC